MLKFSAEKFHYIAWSLGRLQTMCEISVDQPPDEKTTNVMKSNLADIKHACDAIGLRMSAKAAHYALYKLFNLDPPSSYGDLRHAYGELERRISDEIEDQLFLFVPSSDAEFYNGEQLFGKKVEAAFPSSIYEISEAGKCIALGRFTGAVCHLMRVLECGLRAMAVKFKVRTDNKPWNYIIEVAELRLKKIRAAKRKPKNWKVEERFYSEAIAHFRFLKDAWRNYSMHLFERYDEERAKIIFNHTKAFMQQLATKLKEE